MRQHARRLRNLLLGREVSGTEALGSDRRIEPMDFAETWYLETYPDVAAAIAAGHISGAREHYAYFGHAEGRLTGPVVEASAPEVPASPAESAPPAETAPPAEAEALPALESPDTGAQEQVPAEDPWGLAEVRPSHIGLGYLTPTDLRRTRTRLRRTMVIGTCSAAAWLDCPGLDAEHEPDFYNSAGWAPPPKEMPHPPSEYDFMAVVLTLRAVLPDDALWKLGYDDLAGHRKALEECCERIDRAVENLLHWNRRYGIPAFVANFFIPQHGAIGNLLPRYDLRNVAFFIEEINRHLERSVRRFSNAYILDMDRIAASYGRRRMQDDGYLLTSHGSNQWELPIDERIEPMGPLSAHFDFMSQREFISALWAEMVSLHRTLTKVDAVKLVVIDLDDTLWRGVSGDIADVGIHMYEGWPTGVVEALMYLKKRGIMLAIISKNDESRIREIWPSITDNRITLNDFATIRINWRSKPENMAEILSVVNVLPSSVVFLDDNPVERSAMQQAYPEMRILGRHPWYFRRTLLWSAETQVDVITTESGSRTEMMRAQFEREGQRKRLSRAEFLTTLSLEVELYEVHRGDPRWDRAFELLNKTNQFNTTGVRWTAEALLTRLEAGMRAFAFDVRDRFTNYGLVGVCLVDGAEILQMVMSCRVNGLDVELAALSRLTTLLRAAGAKDISAALVETKLNLLCRDLWSRCGFRDDGGLWRLGVGDAPPEPDFITMRSDPRPRPDRSGRD